jgi:hypothetical protein
MSPPAKLGFVSYQTAPTKLISEVGWVLRTKQGAGDELYGLLAQNISRGAHPSAPLLKADTWDGPIFQQETSWPKTAGASACMARL